MTLNFVQQIFFKLFAFIMSVIYSFNGGVVAPSTDDVIKAAKPDAKLVFATVADPQVSNYMFGRYQAFQEACMDLRNAERLDAVVTVGDLAENGLAEEYALAYDELAPIDARFIMATGNHDIRLRAYKQTTNTFCHFANTLNGDDSMNSFHFSERINGYKVIVLGSDKTVFEEAYLSDAQLEWMNDEVKAEDGKPVFVILHQPLKNTHNVEVAWNSPFEGGGTVGAQSIAVKSILSKYDNVFLITGHLHSGFGPDSYNNVDGIHAINLPSLTIENKDGTYNDAGTGYILEVYEDEVVFRARDFAKGVWVADATGDSSYDLVIPVVK